jgi:hypothetical protein
MCTYNNGQLRHFYLDPTRTQVITEAVVSGVTCNMDIQTGTDGAFYYIEGGGYSAGTLHRITGTGPTSTPGVPTPSATTGPPSATATPTTPGPSATPAPPTATVTPGGPTPCPVQFEDVPPGSTFYEWIRCLACRGIVSGYPCGGPGEPCPGTYFRPSNTITRGQAAKIVVSSAGFSDPIPSTQQTFEDVNPANTFWLWIERLAGRGYINGYPCGGFGEPCIGPTNRPYFRVYNDLTRGQLAKIISNAAGYTETPTGQTFQDVPPGSPFYLYVERLAMRSVIGGYPCGGPLEPCIPPFNRPYFRPYTSVLRGQATKMVTQAFFPACSTPMQR